jgi:hypothetical protein
MTDAIVKRNEGNQLAARVAELVKLMIYNGHKLSDPEAMALAQYAVATDLDPFVGECYYLPSIGPGPGIAGWRKKADEQLNYEREQAKEPLARFWCDYVDPTNGEVGKLDDGDVAVKAILHDTLSKTAWEQRTLKYYIELLRAGAKDWDAAKELAGSEPTWSAVGVVKKGENFGRDAMPRYERACKRAEKAAIRKRFPRVHLPEPIGFDDTEVIDTQFSEVTRSEEQNLNELGFDGNPIPPEHDAPAPIQQTTAAMTLEFAENVVTKDGKRYGDLTTEELSYHHNGCINGLKLKITPEKREDLEMKRDASATILKFRETQVTAA